MLQLMFFYGKIHVNTRCWRIEINEHRWALFIRAYVHVIWKILAHTPPFIRRARIIIIILILVLVCIYETQMRIIRIVCAHCTVQFMPMSLYIHLLFMRLHIQYQAACLQMIVHRAYPVHVVVQHTNLLTRCCCASQSYDRCCLQLCHACINVIIVNDCILCSVQVLNVNKNLYT